MSANPIADAELGRKLSIREDGGCLRIRIDVQGATVHYVDGAFEVTLSKSGLPVFLQPV